MDGKGDMGADVKCSWGTAPHGWRDHYNQPGLAHNPWSERCVKRLPGEPYCPNARCLDCDGAR